MEMNLAPASAYCIVMAKISAITKFLRLHNYMGRQYFTAGTLKLPLFNILLLKRSSSAFRNKITEPWVISVIIPHEKSRRVLRLLKQSSLCLSCQVLSPNGVWFVIIHINISPTAFCGRNC